MYVVNTVQLLEGWVMIAVNIKIKYHAYSYCTLDVLWYMQPCILWQIVSGGLLIEKKFVLIFLSFSWLSTQFDGSYSVIFSQLISHKRINHLNSASSLLWKLHRINVLHWKARNGNFCRRAEPYCALKWNEIKCLTRETRSTAVCKTDERAEIEIVI